MDELRKKFDKMACDLESMEPGSKEFNDTMKALQDIHSILSPREVEAAELRAKAEAEAAALRAKVDREVAELRAQTDRDVAELRAKSEMNAAEMRANSEQEAAELHAKSSKSEAVWEFTGKVIGGVVALLGIFFIGALKDSQGIVDKDQFAIVRNLFPRT